MHCREPTAEEVSNKTQANFCDHFKPRPGRLHAARHAGSGQGQGGIGKVVREEVTDRLPL
jgi:hypothetical protein